jgi:PAS domain S-box-containing protein
MQFEYTPYAIPFLVAAVVASVLIIYIWRRRNTRGATALALLSLAALIWTLGYGLEIAGADLATKVFWGKFQYFGIVTVPLLWLVFALQYTSRDKWLTRRHLVWLSVIPIVTLVLALTTEAHGLIWTEYHLAPLGTSYVMTVTHGLAFWVYWAYSQIVVLAGTILVLRFLLTPPGLYRGQAIAILIAVIIPWLGNAMYVLGVNPVPELDLTPLAFTFSAAALTVGIFYFHLTDLAPVARESVVEGMNDGVVVFDPQGRIVDLNPAAQRLLNLPIARAVGRHANEIFQAWPDLLARYLTADEAHDEITAGEGDERRHYELQLSTLRDRRSRTNARVLTVRDISERKQAEEALSRQTARLATLYQLSQDVAATLDMEQVYVAVQRAVEQLMPTDAFFIALVDDKQQEIQFLYLFDQGRRWAGQSQPLSAPGLTGYVIRTGEPLWITDDADGTSDQLGAELFGGVDSTRSLLLVPLKLSGTTIGVISVQHYAPQIYLPEHLQILITLANQVAIALERVRLIQSLRLQAVALDAAANAIVITDQAGLIQWVNPAFTQLTGYTEAEAIGHTPALLKSGQHDAAFYQQLWNAILAGEVWEGEITNRRKDGRLYVERQSITALRDEHDQIFRFIAIKQDITELVQARDQALEASHLKSQLLARVSHELRTPLGVILGYAELLEDGTYGKLTEPQRNVTVEIMDSTRHLTDLVNELLDEAQLEARAVQLQNTPFTPSELLHKITMTMSVLTLDKGLDFHTVVAPEVPPVLLGDEARLRQILVNLIGNAIKFTTTGSVQVRIYCPDREHWALDVADTGCGIPAEAQPYIFEPFRQVDGSMTRQHRGTGLGLSIVKALTELMGGIITHQSEVDRGSTFTITLPLTITAEKSS